MYKRYTKLVCLLVVSLMAMSFVRADISSYDYSGSFAKLDYLANQGLIETGFIAKLAELQDSYAHDQQIFDYLSAVRHYAADIHFNVKLQPDDEYLGYKYVKRSQQIFFDRYKVEGADASSFQVLEARYAQDDSCVYFDMNCVWYNGAASWRLLGGSYSVFGGVLYFNNMALDADASLVEIVGDGYIRTRDAVYFAGRKMPYDVESFEYVGGGIVKDRRGVYYNNAMTHFDSSSIEYLAWNYAKDKYHVYYLGRKFPYDVDSFDVMPYYQHYVSDKNGVYFDNQRIKGADADSFVVHAYPFSQDSNSVYERSDNVGWLRPTCFRVIDTREGLIADCNGIYKRGSRHEGSLLGRMKNMFYRVWSKIFK